MTKCHDCDDCGIWKQKLEKTLNQKRQKNEKTKETLEKVKKNGTKTREGQLHKGTKSLKSP
jgi:hypothetical protein